MLPQVVLTDSKEQTATGRKRASFQTHMRNCFGGRHGGGPINASWMCNAKQDFNRAYNSFMIFTKACLCIHAR